MNKHVLISIFFTLNNERPLCADVAQLKDVAAAVHTKLCDEEKRNSKRTWNYRKKKFYIQTQEPTVHNVIAQRTSDR